MRISEILTSAALSEKLNLYISLLMNKAEKNFSINLLPPSKLFCDFSYWSKIFSSDMKTLWEICDGKPLNSIPAKASDLIFPYLLLALSDYKKMQSNKMQGIGLDCLISLWFDKYSINKKGYFELIK